MKFSLGRQAVYQAMFLKYTVIRIRRIESIDILQSVGVIKEQLPFL